MATTEFKVDTRQLERLSAELIVLPNELASAMRSSLSTGINFSLRKIVSEYYALNPKKIAGTYRVRTFKGGSENSESLRYEVVGRRLSLTHFGRSPFLVGDPRPMVEIIKGQLMQISKQTGADGKLKSPFVMTTGAKSADKEQTNVFRRTGVFSDKKRPVRIGNSVFMAKKEKLQSYRTVSVPQMLGHEQVAERVQEELLQQFDRVLFKKIESTTGITQGNISSR